MRAVSPDGGVVSAVWHTLCSPVVSPPSATVVYYGASPQVML